MTDSRTDRYEVLPIPDSDQWALVDTQGREIMRGSEKQMRMRKALRIERESQTPAYRREYRSRKKG